MKLGQIVNAYRLERGYSMEKFANLCGLSKGYISMLEADKNPKTGRPLAPSLNTFNSIAIAMGLTLDQLMAMCDPDQRVSLTATPDNIIPMPATRELPLLGSIACGEPILADENLDGTVSCPEHVAADFALRCKGDSMINARIFDGDIVYIRQQPKVDDGQIAAVLIGDEATLKRVRLYDDHISLEPENPRYRPIVLWGEDMATVRILGLAVAFTGPVQ